MVRIMDKILKIEPPKRICELPIDSLKIPKTLNLDLVDIESWNDSKIEVKIDLKLDQLED
ncbi:MAG: hypothetical protein P8Y18_07450 [Candidatus Bathyarchaeota archaeon]